MVPPSDFVDHWVARSLPGAADFLRGTTSISGAHKRRVIVIISFSDIMSKCPQIADNAIATLLRGPSNGTCLLSLFYSCTIWGEKLLLKNVETPPHK
jgi:hypothetical protein